MSKIDPSHPLRFHRKCHSDWLKVHHRLMYPKRPNPPKPPPKPVWVKPTLPKPDNDEVPPSIPTVNQTTDLVMALRLALEWIDKARGERRLMIALIQRAFVAVTPYSLEELIGQRRTIPLVHMRGVAMATIKMIAPHQSLPRIGRAFGNRDHTTALHAYNKYRGLIEDELASVSQYGKW